MNFEQIYNEWYASPVSHTVYEAFMAGVVAKENNDPRDVVIARLTIENERLNQRLKEFYDSNRKAKDALSESLRNLDQLWQPY